MLRLNRETLGVGKAIGGIGALVGSLVHMGVPKESAEALDADIQSGAVTVGKRGDVLNALQKGNPLA